MKKEKGYFIVCEGLDCAGKTTNIKRAMGYLEKDGYSVMYSKALKTNTIAGEFSKLFPSTFSLLTEILYLDKFFVRPNLSKGKMIIQDRWYYSVLAHNQENYKDKILGKIFKQFLLKPDLLVYFSVSLEERVRRLKKNIRNNDHLGLLKNPQIINEREKRYAKYYKDFEGDKVIFDTTNISETESGYKLYELIKSYLEREVVERVRKIKL